MPSAIFKCGFPLQLNYTPDAAGVAGDVIIENDVPIILHRDYDPASDVFNVMPGAEFGGGVYECTKATGFAIDWCEALYWNATTGITKTASDKHFGKCVYPAASGDTTVLVEHRPIVGTLSES